MYLRGTIDVPRIFLHLQGIIQRNFELIYFWQYFAQGRHNFYYLSDNFITKSFYYWRIGF